MSETLLWKPEDLARFLSHPQVEVRRWAGDRLRKLFPDQAGPHLLTVLDDPDRIAAGQVIDFLGQTGDAETYGPPLAQRLPGASGWRFDRLATALARLGYRAALPSLIEKAEIGATGSGHPPAHSFASQVEALGIFGSDEARSALWRLLTLASQDDHRTGLAVQGLLRAARPTDVVRLVGRYRSLPPAEGTSPTLGAFAWATGVGRLADEIRETIRDGFEATVNAIATWLGGDPAWSDACDERLARAFRHKLEDVPAITFNEAGRLLAERGDDVTGWQAAWENGADLLGYRRQAVLTLLLLQGLLDQRGLHFSQRRRETSLCLALLSQLSVGQDDQRVLETATDPAGALLDILTADRENVLPDIIEQIVDLGPNVVPRLLERFDSEDYGWAPIRIAQALAQLARRYPGSCDAAIPLLIAAINEDQGDFLLEDCSAALAAIGPAAVPAIAAHLTGEGTARSIYLAGVLGDIPTEGAVRALLAAMSKAPDEIQYSALADVGSPSAITPLYDLHDDENSDWVESLLILCEVNGVTPPELPQWRERMAEEERRMEQFLVEIDVPTVEGDGEIPALEEADLGLPDVAPPIGRSGLKPKKGAAGKREQRRRAAQRKKQRRRK
jgi:HEAT repeat protein